jgi:hypothetical protein
MNNNILLKQPSSSSSSGENSSENIFYYIKDPKTNDTNDISYSLINNEEKLNSLYNECGINLNSFNYYMSNYNVKQLTHIMNYYKINIHKLRKNEMAQLIVLFENEYKNNYMVNQREKLWNYISEIKNDEYLSKFLLFDI